MEIASIDSTSKLENVLDDWRDAVVEDGSLPDTGFEINTNPSSGDLFVNHLEEIGAALQHGDASVSRDCGMHCHVDASDFQWFDLFKLCALYTRIEDALFSIISPSRQDNRYCSRCASKFTFTDPKTFKGELLESLYGHRFPGKRIPKIRQYSVATARRKDKLVFQERTEKYNHARYTALNLHSFFYRGTVEFRHHQGSTNGERAAKWGMLCASILDYAFTHSYKDIQSLEGGSWEILMTILSPTLQEYAIARKTHFENRRY